MSKRLLILAGCLWMAACASNAPNHYAKGMTALSQANYPMAYRLMLMALEAEPDNPMIQRRTEELRVVYNLDQARTLIQADKEIEGIENLRRLLNEYPKSQDAQLWLRKGILKLARKVRFEGDEALASGQLAKAQQKYAQVLLLVPGKQEAIEGLGKVEDRIKHRLDKADDTYIKALDAKAILEWDRVLYLAGICREYDPSRRDAVTLEKAASARTANQLKESAEQLKADRRWGAAAKIYRLATGFAKDAGLEWADDMQGIIDRLMDEVQASQLFERADLLLKAGRIEEAEKLAKEGELLCSYNRPMHTAMIIKIRKAKTSRVVNKARELVLDHRYEEAIELYKQLLGGPSEDFAKAKISSIEENLAELETLYQEALKLIAEGKVSQGKKILRSIYALNPRYKDVEKRLFAQ